MENKYMNIKTILDEIANESSTKQKMVILGKYKDNELLKRVLYLANSGRVKFYIKQIPEYTKVSGEDTLEEALNQFTALSSREVTGKDASDHLGTILSHLSSDDAYVIERIIGKDLKIKMGGNINKVIPDLFEETPYMGCLSYKKEIVSKLFDNGNSCYGQIKMDGQYGAEIIRNGDVYGESRQGEPIILTGAKFLLELSKLPDCVLNGEFTIDGEENRLTANGIMSSLIDIAKKIDERTEEETNKKKIEFKKKHKYDYDEALNKIAYTVWDIITPYEYYNKSSDTPYNERLSKVTNLIKEYNLTMVRVVETVVLTSFEDALRYFQHCLDRGLEGCVIKTINGLWRDGKKPNQVKMKLDMDVDLEIVGFNYGEKGKKNEFVIASLQCKSSDGLLTAEPCGMDEKTMVDVTVRQEELLGTIVDVKSCGITNSKGKHSLLHPRLGKNKFRTDKTVADSYEEILAIENMCKGLTK
jgi:DNA ligase-1